MRGAVCSREGHSRAWVYWMMCCAGGGGRGSFPDLRCREDLKRRRDWLGGRVHSHEGGEMKGRGNGLRLYSLQHYHPQTLLEGAKFTSSASLKKGRVIWRPLVAAADVSSGERVARRVDSLVGKRGRLSLSFTMY